MCRVIKIATWPTRTVLTFAIGLALDLAFGKDDGVEYVSVTRPNDLGETPDGLPLRDGDFW